MAIYVAIFLAFYLWHGMGVTIGYHRLLSHRALKCVKFAEYFWVLGGYLAFEGSPIWWVAIHRAHHRFVDTALDPHSPRMSGIMYSWLGWLVEPGYAPHVDPNVQCPDMLKDPVYRFLEQGGSWKKAHILTFALGIAFRVLLLALFGWQIALCSLIAGLLVLQVPLMLNVFCHMPKLGYKNFDSADDSVNVWWVAVLANGEGWHNNHHAIPGSARSGILPHEFDLSYQTLRLMRKLGMVSYMNESTAPASVNCAPGEESKTEKELVIAA
jgi:stearoyl-CoA desaturase (delta-9 desaturase)